MINLHVIKIIHVEGNCPSFIKVIPSEIGDKRALPAKKYNAKKSNAKKSNAKIGNIKCRVMRISFVTVNQIISTAAFLENKKVVALDQTGLSLKVCSF